MSVALWAAAAHAKAGDPILSNAPQASCHVATGKEEAGVHHDGRQLMQEQALLFWKEILRARVRRCDWWLGAMTLAGSLLGDALFGPAISRRPSHSTNLTISNETKSIGAAAREERHILSYPLSILHTSRYSSQQETSDKYPSQFTFRPKAARAIHDPATRTSHAFCSHLRDIANRSLSRTFFEWDIVSRSLSAFRRTRLPALEGAGIRTPIPQQLKARHTQWRIYGSQLACNVGTTWLQYKECKLTATSRANTVSGLSPRSYGINSNCYHITM